MFPLKENLIQFLHLKNLPHRKYPFAKDCQAVHRKNKIYSRVGKAACEYDHA
jgi:hypothetical protein